MVQIALSGMRLIEGLTAVMIQSADETFRDLFLSFLASRERQMGSDGGGLHAFYSRRLHLGRAFNDGELAAAELILSELPRHEAYVEIGAGFGQLAAWLAIKGVRTVAVERDRARFEGLADLRSLVVRRWPGAGDLFATAFAAFPCELPGVDPRRTLIFSTNLVFGANPEIEQSIIDGMSRYAGALVDTLRFCNDRTEPAAWAELDARFAAAGLPVQQQVWPGGVDRCGGERIMWYRP